jgi:cell division protein FtsW (lipid II flippase)
MDTIIGLAAAIGLAVIMWKVWFVDAREKKLEQYVTVILLVILVLALLNDPIIGEELGAEYRPSQR